MADLMTPTYAHNMRIIGHTDQGGGRADGVQIMVHKGYAYIGHIFSKGFSVVDVRDPTKPKPVQHVAAPPNTWTLHLQQHDDLLLVVHAKDMFAQAELADEKNYYKGKIGDFHAEPPAARDWSAGLAVYDVSKPEAPRQIGFMPIEGGGLHRLLVHRRPLGLCLGAARRVLGLHPDHDRHADPAKPRMAGKFWLPGMNLAAGETPNWPSEYGRYGLHHPIVHGDIAYCSWRDACLAVVDVSDRAAPRLITHRMWAPPFGGGTHNALPLPKRRVAHRRRRGRAGQPGGWREADLGVRQPGQVEPDQHRDLPGAADRDYLNVGGHFGPHNIYENRPDGFVSEDLIFATYQNAGVRVYDIRDKFRPVEVAACVPPAPTKLVDPRPNRPVVLHSADVFVDRNGICYCTDFSAGLYIVEYKG